MHIQIEFERRSVNLFLGFYPIRSDFEVLNQRSQIK